MEIRQFRVTVRARDFNLTCRFYGETLALPKASHWEGESGRGAIFLAGGAAIEVLGRTRDAEERRIRDERYDYQGPDHKMVVSLAVPSAEKAYETLQFRERNIPGGLRSDSEGRTVFETHDPDGVKIRFVDSSA